MRERDQEMKIGEYKGGRGREGMSRPGQRCAGIICLHKESQCVFVSFIGSRGNKLGELK